MRIEELCFLIYLEYGDIVFKALSIVKKNPTFSFHHTAVARPEGVSVCLEPTLAHQKITQLDLKLIVRACYIYWLWLLV